MTHASRATETQIINDINNFDPKTQDLAKLSQDILAAQQQAGAYWQQMVKNINAGADLRKLGFSTDVDLIGVKDNSLVIKDRDGRIEYHDPVRLSHQKTDSVNSSSFEKGNNRFFQRFADGHLEYTVQQPKPGAKGNDREFYQNIARDALKLQTGKDPSETDIYNFIGQMKKVNPDVNFNVIKPGEKLQIPMHAQEGALPVERPTFNQPGQPPRPFQGLSGNIDGQLDAHFKAGKKTTEIEGSYGNKLVKTEGQVNDGTFWDTKAVKMDTLDKNGGLVERNIKYETDKKITLTDPAGKKTEIANAREMSLKWDFTTSTYAGVITTADGQQQKFTADKDGKVTRVALKPPYLPPSIAARIPSTPADIY